jgi:cytochrome c5
MSDQHESLIKTPRQLITIVVLAFVVPIALIILISQLVTGGDHAANESQTAVLERIQPVGDVVIAAPSGPKGQLTGEQVYGQVCKNCHEAGLAGAPKFGDQAAWAKVIAQGSPTVVAHALKGIRGMPAKGGNPDLDDVEVERAVVYMANKGGANWKEPPAPAATASERTGEQVVAATCGKCHQTGEGGAPKIGDRAAWTSRVKKGFDAVVQSALKGHGGMPARGGMAELSDAEIRRAVEYMFNSGIGKTDAAAAAAPSAAAPAPAATAPAATPAAATAAAKPDGKKVYDTVCMVCHAAGVAGAPKFGDKAAWAPRIKTGMDALYSSALKGKGAMPAKGGNAALPDAEVKAAVDYMVAAGS